MTAFLLGSCKKDKFIDSPSASIEVSQDSIIFDTVFTTVGSSTKRLRVRNDHGQKILISSIRIEGGEASPFFMNVDGSPGKSFNDIELAAHDSLYIFIQVNVNPTNLNSPLIITDAINFTVNGNEKRVVLEAWGQDAYYHYPTTAIKFKNGTYLPYSTISTQTPATVTWKKDKPHVIYGYLVVDSLQKLVIEAGVRVYLNYKAGLWVYKGGELNVQGQKGNEVIFEGARRERLLADDPGQWDRIWINEGSDNNRIDYAIIKNGFIGVQAELLDGNNFLKKGTLTISNTIIQNMSMWGLYGLAYKVLGYNVVVSNCQEHSLNLMLGGVYEFYHCTFANYWHKPDPREKTTVNINNYSEDQVLPNLYYFGNCIIDGKRDSELTIDVKTSGTITPTYTFSNSFIKSATALTTTNYIGVVTRTVSPDFKSPENYNFELRTKDPAVTQFTGSAAYSDAQPFPLDLNKNARNTAPPGGVTAGAYEYK
jgi:hypothetical protein